MIPVRVAVEVIEVNKLSHQDQVRPEDLYLKITRSIVSG